MTWFDCKTYTPFLETIKLNLFARSQTNLNASSLYLHWHISSAEDREDAFIVVPSVNMCVLVCRRHPGRSFIFVDNSNGPIIDRCGTLQLINWGLDT